MKDQESKPMVWPTGKACKRPGSRKLVLVTDWVALARASQYRVGLLAQKCGVSVSCLLRYFTDSIQRTPHDVLEHLRFADACRMLTSGRSVKEVAFATGFADAAHFCHRFKQRLGVTPAEWVWLQRRRDSGVPAQRVCEERESRSHRRRAQNT